MQKRLIQLVTERDALLISFGGSLADIVIDVFALQSAYIIFCIKKNLKKPHNKILYGTISMTCIWT